VPAASPRTGPAGVAARAEVSVGASSVDPSDRGPVPSARRPVKIRRATLDDLSTVVALRLALLREHGTSPIYGRLRADAERRARELFGAQLDSPGEVMFLAERAGRVVGILRCVESGGSPLLHPARYCYISSVFVTPTARRAGVLRALVEHAAAWCEERGLDEMRLHSVAGDPVSSAAWDAMGFEVVEYVRMRRLR
jgi:GNAT superfamily N-acetyltransferase